MAVEKVTATLGSETEELLQNNDLYSGEVRAPDTAGVYSLEVAAYDNAGNVSVASSVPVNVTLWTEPKTNWKSTDRFNYSDYNRIKNNLSELHKLAVSLYRDFDIVDMGDNITEYSAFWDVKFFNSWEENLDIINNNIAIRDYGIKQTFYENGPFIRWDELNRIEGAILSMKEMLESQKAGLIRLSFKLGTQKGVRV